MIDENVAPSPVEGVDFDSLSPSPTPEQFYLLSRIDGKTTVAELCKISGLGKDGTLEALELLASTGAIEVPGLELSTPGDEGGGDRVEEELGDGGKEAAGEVSEPTSKGADEAAAAKDSSGAKSSSSEVIPNFPIPPDQYEIDPNLLDSDGALDEGRRRETVCLYEQLSEMTFYDLFGVRPDADRKAIKKAYFRMSKRYHPDKFFRKDIGEFAEMAEKIFKEITKAYRTLSDSDKRAEYDAELQARPDVGAEEASEPSGGHTEDGEARESGSDEAERQEQNREKNKKKAAAVLLQRRAEKLEERGEYEQAAVEYRKALALSRDGQAALRVARVFVDDAQMGEEAASFARAALELEADETSARFLLGRAHELIGSPEAAVDEYRRVLELQPSHPEAKERLEQLDVKAGG